MGDNEDFALVAFKIIAAVGNARSLYIEAIQEAKKGDFDRAQALIKEGGQSFLDGHDAHTGLVQAEAAGDATDMNLMLTHAEDQLMSAEEFGILAEEFIEVYRRMEGMEAELKALKDAA